jgi:hypothetical protein
MATEHRRVDLDDENNGRPAKRARVDELADDLGEACWSRTKLRITDFTM